MRTWGRIAALLAAGVLSAGCDRNIEAFVPGEEPREPDLARIFPKAAMPEGEPAPVMGAQPAGTRGAPPVASSGSGFGEPVSSSGSSPIRGTVRVDPALAGRAPASAVLFVIARAGVATAGPPLAVRRIPSPRFPAEFEIGPDDVMIQGMRFEGEIRLSARLDADGNAMTRRAGDLQGRAASAVAPGAEGVELVLDEPL
jgi:cytochrome c-type biogenesis protein CcmH